MIYLEYLKSNKDINNILETTDLKERIFNLIQIENPIIKFVNDLESIETEVVNKYLELNDKLHPSLKNKYCEDLNWLITFLKEIGLNSTTIKKIDDIDNNFLIKNILDIIPLNFKLERVNSILNLEFITRENNLNDFNIKTTKILEHLLSFQKNFIGGNWVSVDVIIEEVKKFGIYPNSVGRNIKE